MCILCHPGVLALPPWNTSFATLKYLSTCVHLNMCLHLDDSGRWRVVDFIADHLVLIRAADVPREDPQCQHSATFERPKTHAFGKPYRLCCRTIVQQRGGNRDFPMENALVAKKDVEAAQLAASEVGSCAKKTLNPPIKSPPPLP